VIILKTEKRRKNVLKRLKESENAIIGSKLAEEFEVSRQVIVQDIALLRAKGEKIIATSQGYLYPESNKDTIQATIACKHGESEEVQEELMIIVSYGAKIIDVIVEHPIYGELKGMLMIKTPADVKKFIKNYRENNASLLASLTDGVHLHTIEALNEQVVKKIREELDEKGYLLEK